MALIKSALELALERTKNLEVDEVAIQAAEVRNAGKKAAGKYLDDPELNDLGSSIKKTEAAHREAFRKAAFDVLISQIQLPGALFDAEKFARVGKGLEAVAGAAANAGAGSSKEVASLIGQIGSFLSKYLEEIKRVEQAIKNQWAPKLKEKERQLAARMGRDVRVDPMSDPEFSAFYKQNVEAMRANYSDALERAKSELAGMCGFSDKNDIE